MSADAVWGLWFLLPVASLLAFFGIELPAVAKHEWARTLSDTIRRWMGISPAKPRRYLCAAVFTVALFGFPAWFWPHIVLGL